MKKKAEQKAANQQYENDIAARDEQRAYDRDALQRLVVDAEKAGFNPLTIMRNGGTSYQNSGAPLLSRRVVGGSAMGDALIGAGDAFLEKYDPFADQKREQEYRLVESQIASLNASALSDTRNAMRSYATGDYERRPSGKAAALSTGVNAPGEGTLVGGDNPTVSGVGWNDGKKGWFHAPWMPDAGIFENVYGDNEPLSIVYSVGKLLNDGGYSLYRNGKYVIERAATEVKRRNKLPQTRHQADPGSWLDFAPKLPAKR